jgi:hypothetical protein
VNDGRTQKSQLVSNVSEYFHILNKEETRLLFMNLEEVFTRIYDLDIHNKKLRKKIYGRKGSNSYSSNPTENTVKFSSNMLE